MELEALLTMMVEREASDLFISPGTPLHIKVDGVIAAIDDVPLEADDVAALAAAVMDEAQQQAFAERPEMNLGLSRPGLGRFRINVFRERGAVAMVVRHLQARIPSIGELNLPPLLTTLATAPRGLLLVVGATGSGKSTTLAAMINYINDTRPEHVLTIEDPIEFVHESKKCLVNQREVHRDTLGFNEALRSALREDPDIILVGEMRDLETIRLALTAAETGHLVFGTLHTSSAAKTIDRIIDVFPAAEKSMVRSMLSESLRAVISQSLLKKTGGGRIAAHEIMIGTPAIRNLVREDKVAQMYSAIQTGQAAGMQTLDQCLQDMVRKGSISRTDARAKAANKESF